MSVHHLRMDNIGLRQYVARLTFESKRHELIGRSRDCEFSRQLLYNDTGAAVIVAREEPSIAKSK